MLNLPLKGQKHAIALLLPAGRAVHARCRWSRCVRLACASACVRVGQGWSRRRPRRRAA